MTELEKLKQRSRELFVSMTLAKSKVEKVDWNYRWDCVHYCNLMIEKNVIDRRITEIELDIKDDCSHIWSIKHRYGTEPVLICDNCHKTETFPVKQNDL